MNSGFSRLETTSTRTDISDLRAKLAHLSKDVLCKETISEIGVKLLGNDLQTRVDHVTLAGNPVFLASARVILPSLGPSRTLGRVYINLDRIKSATLAS